MTRRKLTITEHKQLGHDLLRLRAETVRICEVIHGAIHDAHPTMRKAADVLDAIDALRAALASDAIMHTGKASSDLMYFPGRRPGGESRSGPSRQP